MNIQTLVMTLNLFIAYTRIPPFFLLANPLYGPTFSHVQNYRRPNDTTMEPKFKQTSPFLNIKDFFFSPFSLVNSILNLKEIFMDKITILLRKKYGLRFLSALCCLHVTKTVLKLKLINNHDFALLLFFKKK